MSSAAQELIEIVNGLPEDKAREVVDFARFLQQQSGDQEWERIIAEKRAYPKLERFAAESLREDVAQPLPETETHRGFEVVMTPELERLLDEGLENLDQARTADELRNRQ